jgi:hypothetical protein
MVMNQHHEACLSEDTRKALKAVLLYTRITVRHGDRGMVAVPPVWCEQPSAQDKPIGGRKLDIFPIHHLSSPFQQDAAPPKHAGGNVIESLEIDWSMRRGSRFAPFARRE